MASVQRRGTPIHRPLSPPPDPPPPSLEISHPASAPIPNKRLPFCPTGPPIKSSADALRTPPETPPSKDSSLKDFSLLQCAQSYSTISQQPLVHAIRVSDLIAVQHGIASTPFPDPNRTFPWLHGIHVENQMQLAFFASRRGFQRDVPKCFDWITVVKCGGDLSSGCLKGAVSPEDILEYHDEDDATFLDVDPKSGFGIRNFQIQIAKLARVTDIVVYRDRHESEQSAHELAKLCAMAQRHWNNENGSAADEFAPTYNTFLLSDTFEQIEHCHQDLVAVNSSGDPLPTALDFSQMERQEMCKMTEASEITHNLWLGPTPCEDQASIFADRYGIFNVLIEANDTSPPPDTATLNFIRSQPNVSEQRVGFPSSGSILPQSWPMGSLDPLTAMCNWIYEITHTDGSNCREARRSRPEDSMDIPMRDLAPKAGRKVLLHCTDGYTETTLLALAYFMYAEQVSLSEAILRLHNDKQRNFFAYPSDIALLQSLQPTLLTARKPKSLRRGPIPLPLAPSWLSRMDGSLPSRIMPYLYLGNLTHANNPELLEALNIGQVLSIGEPVEWTPVVDNPQQVDKVVFIDRIQDNGVDPLTGEIDRCLDFIARGKSQGTATLVHCRVGVSRSATVCIAEVMASLGLSFPRAYCLVRARRLNVIIQPHLLFVYELMKFDELCQQRRGEEPRREMEWTTVCREIARMNKPYCSR